MSIRRQFIAGIVTLVAAAGFCGVASAQELSAQELQARNWCVNKPKVTADLQISGCTTIIEAGKETTRNLAVAFNNRGSAYGRKGQADRAIQDFDQAIRLEPNYNKAIISRGTAHNIRHEYDRAIEDFDQAIKLDPNVAEAFVKRGFSYESKGQYDRAIQDYNQAIKLDPNFAPAVSYRGAAYMFKEQNDRAIEDFNLAIKLNPHDATTFYLRSLARMKNGNFFGAAVDLVVMLSIKLNTWFWGET